MEIIIRKNSVVKITKINHAIHFRIDERYFMLHQSGELGSYGVVLYEKNMSCGKKWKGQKLIYSGLPELKSKSSEPNNTLFAAEKLLRYLDTNLILKVE